MPSALTRLADLPKWYRTALDRYQIGASTVKVDWALDGPIPWENPDVTGAGTVHVAGSESEFLHSVKQSHDGLSDHPFLLLGQQSVADPTRAPAGQHTAWAYTHGPQQGVDWVRDTPLVAERMEEQVERFAPGFRDRILARHIQSPADLEARNPNLIGGDVGGGSYRLNQVVFRPLPKLTPYSTPLKGLFIGSAATFPGGAVHGVPGRRRRPRRAPVIPALPHRALYAAFDRFPSRKGSAVHIDRFARALFDRHGGGLLYVLGGEGLPSYQREGNIEIVRYMREAEHVLERAAGYGARLAALLEQLPDLEIAHFRDPWGGIPIIEHGGAYQTVYEVNGLPSIELPFLYPAIPGLEQIAELERRCLEAADLVITPSQVTADRLPVPATVIPNGADVRPRSEPPPLEHYLLYFGALQPWQGVDTALRAVARLDLAARDLRLRPSAPREAVPQAGRAPRRPSPLAPRAARGGARPLARPRAAQPGAAAGLLPQRPPGLRAAEDPRVDGGRRARGRLRPAGRARADRGRRDRPPGPARPPRRAGPRDPRPARLPRATRGDGRRRARPHRAPVHVGAEPGAT